jgi:predicted polyphosphate/ATP-dependent NAD kinase
VAHATTVDNQEKVSIVRRVLVGLGAAGVQNVLLMPDTYRLGERALDGLSRVGQPLPQASVLEMPVTDGADDSELAAALFREAGAGCIVVLGGDGTVRSVSKGAGEVPVLAISTGTNNVLPTFTEGTIAGLAAGAVACQQVDLEAVAVRHKWLELVVNGLSRERALVDVAALSGSFVGSRAVWTIQDLRQVIVTRADPASIGISAIPGVVRPVSVKEPVGLALTLSAQASWRVLAAIGPGIIDQVGIAAVQVIELGNRCRWTRIAPWCWR